jgi:hypothetical protein
MRAGRPRSRGKERCGRDARGPRGEEMRAGRLLRSQGKRFNVQCSMESRVEEQG